MKPNIKILNGERKFASEDEAIQEYINMVDRQQRECSDFLETLVNSNVSIPLNLFLELISKTNLFDGSKDDLVQLLKQDGFLDQNGRPTQKAEKQGFFNLV